MSTPSARQPKGVSVGGQFAATTHDEPSVTLSGPRVDAGYVAEVLGALPWHRTTSPEMTEEITDRLNQSRNFSDQNVADMADEVWRETHGHTAKEETNFQFALDTLRAAGEQDAAEDVERYLRGRLKKAFDDGAMGRHTANPYETPAADVYSVPGTNTRLHVLRSEPVPDGKETPVPSEDPRLQAGEVFDRVNVAGSTYTRSEVLEYPNDPYTMRFQANRPLSDEEAYALSGVIGYANRSAIGGEPMDDPLVGPARDTPYSFIVNIDTTKGRQRNYEKFEGMIPDIIARGSAPRSTQGGTRAIQPFGDPDLKLEVYYGD
ncbi:hypothetical protein IV500_06090 [Paeniglutamicibacter antarcticus]|uniref:Uncharacterized protein n=1 Tax=Arthrobacter terrae TaxID=2935737 RepID=A0A931CIL4_9MICC|nr:hypothetical protein [Arthrobacter terrae]MBG0738993.1 hypothetical protein [Arthrobacter terrae]